MCKLANKIQASGWLFNPGCHRCVLNASEAERKGASRAGTGVQIIVAEAVTGWPRQTAENKKEVSNQSEQKAKKITERTPRRARKIKSEELTSRGVRAGMRTILLPKNISRHDWNAAVIGDHV